MSAEANIESGHVLSYSIKQTFKLRFLHMSETYGYSFQVYEVLL